MIVFTPIVNSKLLWSATIGGISFMDPEFGDSPFSLTNEQVLFLLKVWGVSAEEHDGLVVHPIDRGLSTAVIQSLSSVADQEMILANYALLSEISNPFISDSLSQMSVLPTTLGNIDWKSFGLSDLIPFGEMVNVVDIGSANSIGGSLILQLAIGNAVATVRDQFDARLHCVELVRDLHDAAKTRRGNIKEHLSLLLPEANKNYGVTQILGDTRNKNTLALLPSDIAFGTAFSSITRYLKADKLAYVLNSLLEKTRPGGVWVLNGPTTKDGGPRMAPLQAIVEASKAHGAEVIHYEVPSPTGTDAFQHPSFVKQLRNASPTDAYDVWKHFSKEKTETSWWMISIRKPR